MREYETVIITRPDLPDSQFNQTGEKIKAIIEKHEGRLFYARSMGRRQMAYPIKKETKGMYTCYDYVAKGPAVNELERSLRIDDTVLRFLTVVKNEEVDVEARAAEIVARGEDVAGTAAEEAKPAEAATRNPAASTADDDASDDDTDESGKEN
jgi:small subunit ribosomal protein S6